MSGTAVKRQGPDRLAIVQPSGTTHMLNGAATCLHRSDANTGVCYVVTTQQSGAKVIVVEGADSESRAVLDALPRREDPVLVERLLGKREDVEPAAYLGTPIDGSIALGGTVLTITAGQDRWDYVPDREPTPEVTHVSASQGQCEIRLRMPGGRGLRLVVTEPMVDEALRAVAVLRTAQLDGHDTLGSGTRWQHGIVNIGMYFAVDRMSEILTALGPDGWELINVYDKASNWMQGMEKGFMLFKRPVPPGVKLAPREWCLRLGRTGPSS